MAKNESKNETFTFDVKPDPIKGFPELHWKGKHPYSSTQYYPAQLKEVYGGGMKRIMMTAQ